MNKTPSGAVLQFIGEIRTPFNEENCPRWADESLDAECRIVLLPQFQAGLKDLEKFKYIYVFFYLDRPHKAPSLTAHPPRLQGGEVGVFASRSPNRLNPIALSVVRLKRIENGELVTSAIDAFDCTPLIDIKPYFKDDDFKSEANSGWMDELPAGESKKK